MEGIGCRVSPLQEGLRVRTWSGAHWKVPPPMRAMGSAGERMGDSSATFRGYCRKSSFDLVKGCMSVQGLRFRLGVSGLGNGCEGLGFSFRGSGFRVEG